MDDFAAPSLPTRELRKSYRIWDSYFLPSDSGPDASRVVRDIERSMPAIRLAEIEKLCIFPHVGLGTTDPITEARVKQRPESLLAPFRRWPRLLIGMIQLNANDVSGSLSALDRWLRDGPMVGVYFPGGRRGSLTCTHANFRPLVKRINQLGGLIMQHTWFKTTGKDSPGESTPSELAQLAMEFPDQPFICAHAGGEWEKGVRAIRGVKNVFVETSGFDATSGFIDFTVSEIGADRILFGSHLPSRSLGTELSKILEAALSDEDRRKVLGGNFRRLLRMK